MKPNSEYELVSNLIVNKEQNSVFYLVVFWTTIKGVLRHDKRVAKGKTQNTHKGIQSLLNENDMTILNLMWENKNATNYLVNYRKLK